MRLVCRFEDDLDVFVPDDIPAPAAADLLAIGAGFADAFGGAHDYNPRDVPQVLWQGMVRSGRRRGNGNSLYHLYAINTLTCLI